MIRLPTGYGPQPCVPVSAQVLIPHHQVVLLEIPEVKVLNIIVTQKAGKASLL
jgi:hypothetical protein